MRRMSEIWTELLGIFILQSSNPKISRNFDPVLRSEPKVTGLCPLSIMTKARLICDLTWVCEGLWMGRGVVEKAG